MEAWESIESIGAVAVPAEEVPDRLQKFFEQTPQDIKCPECKSTQIQDQGESLKCRSCGWAGMIYECHPRHEDSAPAETARMEDAVCANHTGKKAIAICAGTGDYICSLCRVHLNGQDYSVQYLDRGGKQIAAQTFTQKLLRPDRMVIVMLFCSIIIGIGILAPFFFAYSTVSLRRALAARKEDAIFAKVWTPAWMWISWVINLLVAAAMVITYSRLFGDFFRYMPGRF